tara:strand:- start:10933 stop:11283 length:351 start_codon:yes stop_codon:yes gene_type:complete
MSSPDNLKSQVKEWLAINNVIIKLQAQIKELKDRKNKITEGLVDVMKTNDIDAFDVNDGQMIYQKNKVKSTIGKKMLHETLRNYLNNPETADQIAEHILNSRTEKVKENIKIKLNK